MAELFSKVVRESRRLFMISRKKLSLYKYNLQIKTQMGKNPDAFQDALRMTVSHKSLNLLDFARNRDKDLFLLDVNSDRTEFGGISETELTIRKDNLGDNFCK